MTDMIVPLVEEKVPLAMINTLSYCPRRFVYEYVQGEMLINEHVLEGMLQHEGVDIAGHTWREGGGQERRVWVWSDRLGLIGICDVVQTQDDAIYPVEYKKGKPNKWRNDHAQLCAQAMCLEEQLGCTISEGDIFYAAVRRHEHVIFSDDLRNEVVRLVQEARRLVMSGELPPPQQKKTKCRECSLQPICLPNEVRQLQTQSVFSKG